MRSSSLTHSIWNVLVKLTHRWGQCLENKQSFPALVLTVNRLLLISSLPHIYVVSHCYNANNNWNDVMINIAMM